MNFSANLIFSVLICFGFSAARAWDPNKPFIYEMRIAFETDNWFNAYSTATVLSKSDNTEAFRVVANSTMTPTYQLLVTTQGNVGISTGLPTQKLEVAGTIYSSSGGFKFPDGSTQTAAGIKSPASSQEGDILYYTNGAWSRLPAGTGGQYLKMGFDGYVKLLVAADGTDGSTTFTDTATGKTVTVNGNAQIDTAQSKFGGASALFDGTGDYLTLSDSEDWNFGSGDFTIELWARSSVLLSSGWLAFWQHRTDNNHWLCGGMESGKVSFVIYNSGFVMRTDAASTDGIAADTWVHIAWVRASGVYKIFVAGTQQASLTDTDNPENYTGNFEIGRNTNEGGSSTYFNGWLDEFRVSKGVARWTANFTPPSLPYSASLNWSY